MTIIPRGKRWGVKAWDRGQRKYVWLGTFDTREQAEQAGRDAGAKYDPASPLVSDWGRVWLSDYARRAAATRMVYRQAVNRITKDLGALRLDEVTRRVAREKALVWPRNTSAVARTMWADAKRDEVCAENPWTNMRLQQSRGRKDIHALTEAQVLELAGLADDEMRALILTLAYVGLRPGELCALRWRNVDLDARRIHVTHSRDVTGVEKAPKNYKARRVQVPPVAVEALRRLPRPLSDPDAYVFHSYRGQRLSKANLHYRWRPIAVKWEALGNGHLTLYELRHAAATMRLERGMSASDVAIQLGHEDGGALILSTYGHPDRERALERNDMAFSEVETPDRVRRSGAV